MEVHLSDFALRPAAPAKKGRPIYVKTNIFPLIEEDHRDIYQYDVVVNPEVSVEDTKSAWKKFEVQIRKKLGGDVFIAFDGKKNAYSASCLEKVTIKVQIDRNSPLIPEYPPLPAPEMDRGGGRGGGRGGFRGGRGRGGRGGSYGGEGYDNRHQKYQRDPPRAPVYSGPGGSYDPDLRDIEITMKPTTSVNLGALKKFILKEGPECDDCLHSITAITSFVRHIPSFKFVSIGPNLYSPDERVAVYGGLEIWRGFHQSIRALKAGHLGVNVDVAAAVFRRGNAKLLDLILEVLRLHSPEDLVKIRDLPDKISSSFKGANMVMTHIPGKKIRFKATGVCKENANQFSFDGPNGRTNVARYFKDTYGITLEYPHLPLILKGSKSAIPIEILTMSPSQRFLKRLSPDQVTYMIRNTVMKPIDRSSIIERATSSTLRLTKNNYIDSIGYRLDPNCMTVPARVIDSPSVIFGDNRSVSGKEGFWKMPGKVSRPMKLYSYAFVFFCDIRNDEAYQIAKKIINTCKDIGIQIPPMTGNRDIPVLNRGAVRSSRDVKSVLENACGDASRVFRFSCQLIFCIIRKGAKLMSPPTSLYDEIKRVTLTELDVLSQCMLYEKTAGDRLNNQYAENVAIKVNVKLGGATNCVDSIPLFDVRTLLFGADVTHAHAGSVAPSVAAVVASVDPYATRYYSYLRAQPSRQEIITDLHSIACSALDAFVNNNEHPPQRVIFFRDGVSTGQFSHVMKNEVSALKRAFESKGYNDIALTFVIVQKRHHVRFFPTDNNRDKSGNCLPGTVVDDVITHPVEYNFYLQSHAGIQGTSRPTLYHVLLDENKIGSDDLQKLCYNLCFLSERATRSISMVSPAYRAHIAALMGRIFLEADVDYSELSGSTSREIQAVLRPVRDLMDKNTMYYM